MSQNYRYPSSAAATVTIAAIGPNGAPIPSSSILIAGEDPSLNLHPIQVDATGKVIISSLAPLPVSGTVKAQLQADDGTPIDLGQALMAASLPVTIASNQSALPITAASLPLPTGAATEATLLTRGTEATLATRATEATLATRASEATIAARLAGSLVPAAYDEIALTYTGSNLTTVVYKLATVTVKTLTLSYTGSQLDNVLAS